MKQLEYDLEKAFTPMPAQIHEAIEIAFERGDKEMKKRHKITVLLAAAAVFAVVFAVGALAVSGMYTPRPDNTVLAMGGSVQTTQTPKNIAQSTPTPIPMLTTMFTPTPMPTAYQVPDFVSYPILADEAELELNAEEDAHFYHGDFTDAEALYALLGNAYYAHLQENGLQPDSRVVYIASQELKALEHACPNGKEEWSTLVWETLQSVLGFSTDFIAEHYLVNDVIACLWAESEYGPQETNTEPTYAPDAAPTLIPGPRLIEGNMMASE